MVASLHDLTYFEMLETILSKGRVKEDRTGTGTTSYFGGEFRFDLSEGFPLLTSKELNWNNIVVELLWFLRGDTNIKYMVDRGCNIWVDWPLKNYNHHNHDFPMTRKEFIQAIRTNSFVNGHGGNFADLWGDCGPVYGKQWRKWKLLLRYNGLNYAENGGDDYMESYHDQIFEVIEALKTNPYSRRHIVSAWNVADIPAMIPSGLPPCHTMFQFNARPMNLRERLDYPQSTRPLDSTPWWFKQWVDSEATETVLSGAEVTEAHAVISTLHPDTPRFYLDCKLYQRSADAFLGVPYNIASYSLLIHLIAQQVGMVPGEFIHTFGDLHIYNNHRAQVAEQLEREGEPSPTVHIAAFHDDLTKYEPEDFRLVNYNPQPAISAPIAI